MLFRSQEFEQAALDDHEQAALDDHEQVKDTDMGCLSIHVFLRSCVLESSFDVIFHCPSTVPIQRT